MENHTPYLLEYMMVYKFHPDFNSEIGDRTEFLCEGCIFKPTKEKFPDDAKQLLEKPLLDEDRAFFYTVRLVDAPDIESPQTSYTFSSFSYITDLHILDIQELHLITHLEAKCLFSLRD